MAGDMDCVVSSSTEPESELCAPNVQKLSSDLRPLMFWMSNATELLNFFQVKVETMEKEWEFEGKGSHLNHLQVVLSFNVARRLASQNPKIEYSVR